MTASDTAYFVRLRERGDRQHFYLGRNALVRGWMHSLMFATQTEASEAMRWMVQRNPSLDSGQVLHGFGGKVVEQQS
jgi:hypothetical protein